MKKLILAAALTAASLVPAFAEGQGPHFYGTPERQVTNTREFGTLREFSLRRAPAPVATTSGLSQLNDRQAYPMAAVSQQ
ncbi:hypothetical protein [Phreatobacter stygius]|uniref:Alpha/beta hydrolase n=1 Tax=Phreatobacter stygius TaxID=1940610 RepID=A0A4D7BA87_9HYPH|nr:hypothetical protein [Phreatobacter stygius]QCI64987.1 hypothetical protein E8M01_12600 [Phreatobacter stygius]